jgi:hypothetical protein
MTQEELLKALKGGSGRKETQVDFGQVGLRPTIQRGGQYNVQVQQAPETNPALQLADALKGGSQLLGQFVDIQSKQGEIEANALSPQEVIKRVESGDPEAVSFLDKLGKEKAFVETSYKRYFKSTVQPQLTALAQELQSKPVHEYADQGITTAEDFKVYTDTRVKELTDKFGEYTDKSPYAKVLHNQLIEAVIPDLVQRQVSAFDQNVTKFNQDFVKANQLQLNEVNNVNPAPTSALAVSAPTGSTITDYGQIGKQGSYKDPNLDSASALGMGFRVPPADQEKIRKGLPSIHKLVKGDIAVSPDIRDQLEKNNVKYMDKITVTLADGTTHTGRWMDVTAKVYDGKNLSGRFDIYTPEGRNPLVGKQVAKWSTDEVTVEQNFKNNVNNVLQVNAEALATRGKYSPTAVAQIIREDVTTQVKTLSTDGKFAEARKLLGALNESKLGGQPLFGSTEGRANFVGLTDLINREEDQFSAKNSADEERQTRELSATYELDALRDELAGGNREERTKQQTADVLAREDLSDFQKSTIIKNLDQAQNKAYQANIDASSMVQKAMKDFGVSDQVMKTAVVAQQPSDAFDWASLNLPKETMEAIVTRDLNGQPSVKPGAVQLLSQTIEQSKYATEEALQTVTQELLANKEMSYNGVKYDISTPALKREVGSRLATIINDKFTEDIKTSFTNNINRSQFKQAAPQAVSDEEQALFDAKLLKFAGDAKLARADLENDKRKVNQETSVVNSDGTVRVGVGLFESAYSYSTKAINSLTKGLIKNSKGEVDTTKNYEVFSSAKTAVHNSQYFPYDLDDYYAAPLGSKQQAKAVKNVRRVFQEVGFPIDAIQSGFIQKTFTKIGTNDSRTVLFSIEDDLRNKESYKTLPIIPAHWLQKRDEPMYASAIKKFSSKWGISKTQVADQEALYQSRGIKVTK